MTSESESYRFPTDLDSEPVKKVARIPYPTLRKIGWHEFKPRFERFLYRYSSLDIDSEEARRRLEDVLIRSTLWLSSPQDFNDPFDSQAFVPGESDPVKRRKKLDDLVRLHEPNLKWRQRTKKVDQMMVRSPEQWRLDSTAIIESNAKQLGVCCFTKDSKNLLMWSHYASSHTGLCLQFETFKDIDVFGRASPVQYTTAYPEVNIFTYTPDDLIRLMLSKFKHWEYEKELRITAPEGAHKKLAFNPGALTGIVLGVRMPADTRSKIHQLLETRTEVGLPSVQLYQAVQHPRAYKLSIERVAFK